MAKGVYILKAVGFSRYHPARNSPLQTG